MNAASNASLAQGEAMNDQTVDVSFEPEAANVVTLPRGELPRQLAGARSDFERLRQSILTVQRCLRTLEAALESMDHPPSRGLRDRMAHLDELLVVRLDQLSRTDRLLQELLHRR
jgi:hypothetical protein